MTLRPQFSCLARQAQVTGGRLLKLCTAYRRRISLCLSLSSRQERDVAPTVAPSLRHPSPEEGYAACNPMQIGFARAFCDIHCVRDAVIRGDRSIIRFLTDMVAPNPKPLNPRDEGFLLEGKLGFDSSLSLPASPEIAAAEGSEFRVLVRVGLFGRGSHRKIRHVFRTLGLQDQNERQSRFV